MRSRGGRLFSMSFFLAISIALLQTTEDCDGGSMGPGFAAACTSLLGGEIWGVPGEGGAGLSLVVGSDNT